MAFGRARWKLSRLKCMLEIDRIFPHIIELPGYLAVSTPGSLLALLFDPSVICAGTRGLGRYLCRSRVALKDGN